MIDIVPNATSPVLDSKENLQFVLLQQLYKPQVLDDLLMESKFIIGRSLSLLKVEWTMVEPSCPRIVRNLRGRLLVG